MEANRLKLGKSLNDGNNRRKYQKARNKLGLTPRRLSEKIWRKATTLTKIEGDMVIKPSAQTVTKIAKALGVPMEDLVK